MVLLPPLHVVKPRSIAHDTLGADYAERQAVSWVEGLLNIQCMPGNSASFVQRRVFAGLLTFEDCPAI
jgi:hypothetical protein